ncbi:ABC transporter ATP-binding protein [Streptomyces sp. WMMC897]|uniref:ABC transporter ATP-binding protein n=1 Tax=Streptomyces sp. WMMC897 TaxID=3014782 RepID=UPI0022B74B20|nr:ABC transporter ATP-binding protein [Streptomyces sp. WMMC897]MCZ7414998.1 ABC transporter ATP-binding protein [Streptomyces sp. WMMC897]
MTPGPQAASPLLDVRGLHVEIAGSRIVQGVDLAVPAEGVTALLGRNGVGKTTTVRAVLGLLPDGGRVTAGTVTLDGADVTDEPTHRTVRRGVGYAPEDRGVFAHLTVAENLSLAERPGSAHHYDLVHDLFPELRDRRAQPAGSLSGGQQQMVAIARTLLNDNRLIVVDEPTKGLAPRVVTEVTEVLERAAERVPLLLVEQNLAVVRRLARHAVVLDAGRTVHTGDAAALLADRELTTALLGVGARPGPPGPGPDAGPDNGPQPGARCGASTGPGDGAPAATPRGTA